MKIFISLLSMATLLLPTFSGHAANKKPLALRGQILHFFADPKNENTAEAFLYLKDGVLIVQDGYVKELIDEERHPIWRKLSRTKYRKHRYKNGLIVPGFVDGHMHYPQTDMIGQYAVTPLEWLYERAFKLESKFHDKKFAKKVAKDFMRQALANGITTPLAMATIHPESVDAIFEEAEKRNMRLLSGKVLMDFKSEDGSIDLSNTPEQMYNESRALIQKWHKKPGTRLLYSMMPRGTKSATKEGLRAMSRLLDEFPDLYIHTHSNETKIGLNRTIEYYGKPDLISIWEDYNVIGRPGQKPVVFAHGTLHSESEFQRMKSYGAAVTFCPNSNLLSGLGPFDYRTAVNKFDLNMLFGTDIGGGSTFSFFPTMDAANKELRRQGGLLERYMDKEFQLNPLRAFYHATLGGAKALQLDDKIGNFEVGKEADIAVIDLASTKLLKKRSNDVTSLNDLLYLLYVMGGESTIKATYLMGVKQ